MVRTGSGGANERVEINTPTYRMAGHRALQQLIRDLKLQRVEAFSLAEANRVTQYVVNYYAS
ncbi:hypothetical protein D7S86_06335 [Pararobbsia silviterrae]|uniref:Uncharacterized protein n=2 Tax=Pararobbsia silviterrae TaxID=1792498 RepID=A0A494Y4G7_9BURK|nr:hypothetical protein D7S86_06335 [Pararobbsia silviterrae]